MDWQLLAVDLLILAAALYLARQAWRTWRGRGKGCGGCGGAKKAPAARPGAISLPLRDGPST
jgi:hypothetical protein